jgi:protein translocase SecG subunit
MAILGIWYLAVLSVLLILFCIILVLVVLIQRGRGGGLAGAFGGVGGHSVLGAKTGDFLTWVTIACAAMFVLLSVGLNLLTPKPPGSADDGTAEGETTVPSKLAASPSTFKPGERVKLSFSVLDQEYLEVDTVEFFLDADGNEIGEPAERIGIGEFSDAESNWSLVAATEDWSVGDAVVLAVASRRSGSDLKASARVTVEAPETQPAATQPTATQPTATQPATVPTTTTPATTTTAPATAPAPASGPSATSPATTGG